MAQNNGCLYNKVPDAYMPFGNNNQNSTFAPSKGLEKSRIAGKQLRKSKRHVFIDWDTMTTYTSFFRSQWVRIINIGKTHVDYQIESRNGHFGMKRSAKLIYKQNKVYFEIKNKKYFLKKANFTI